MLPSKRSGSKFGQGKDGNEVTSSRTSPGRFQVYLASALETLLERVVAEHRAEISALEAEVEILQKRSGVGADTSAKAFSEAKSECSACGSERDERTQSDATIRLSPHDKSNTFKLDASVRGKPPEDVAASLPAGWPMEEPSSFNPPHTDASSSSLKGPRKIADGSELDERESLFREVASEHSRVSSQQEKKSLGGLNEVSTPQGSERSPSANGKDFEQVISDSPPAKFKLLPAWENRSGFNSYRRSGGRATSAENDSVMSPCDENEFGRKGSDMRVGRTTMSFNSDAFSEASSLNGDYYSTIRCAQRTVLTPSSKRNIFWKICGLFLLLYDVVVVPLEVFNLPDNWFLVSAMWIIRLYWLMDMVLCFITGYFKSQGNIEMRLGKVAQHYLKTWFALDFICIVCDWLILFSGPREHDGWRGIRMWRAITLLRVTRLFRLAKAPEIEGYISEHVRSERMRLVAAIAKIIGLLVSIAHIIACVWYGLGIHVRDIGGASWVLLYDFTDKGIGERYAVSIHWSLSQFMGENIIDLQHVGERTFAIVTLLFAFVSSAIFVSSITTLMTKLQLISSKQSSQFSVLRRYLLQHGISTNLAVRVLRNAHHHFSKNSLHATEENVDLLKKISTSLQMEVRFEVYFPVIEKHPFFQRYFEVNPVGIRKVCHRALTSTSAFPGDIVFSQDETAEHPRMFFLLSGHLSYVMDGLQAARMVKGSWACEPVLWTAWIHLGTLQATAESTILNLDAKMFQNIIIPFPSPHAHAYGASFVQQANSNPGLLTDLAGVDLAECLCNAFAEMQEDCPGSPINAWGIRTSISSKHGDKRRSSWTSLQGIAQGARRNSRELKLSLGLPVTPWNEGNEPNQKQSILQKLGSGIFNSSK